MTKGMRSRARGMLLCAVVITALSILALALPAAGHAVVNIEGITLEQLPDYDSRAAVAPSADQFAAAQALGADVTWNRFGVASSVSNAGRYVTTGLQAPDAVSAARNWLAANKALFKLDSTDSLAVAAAQPFVGTTNDYAVVFRQVADGVASTDGVATVAVVGSKDDGWNVVYASSSLTGGSTDATGSTELAPAEAWIEAANDVGLDASVVDVAAQTTKAGATTLAVSGITQAQHVKKAVFATPHHGARAAYVATVTTGIGANLEGYEVVVDAQTGDVLSRENTVFNATNNPTWLAFPYAPAYNPLNAFPWNYPNTDIRELFCWTAIAACQRIASDASTVYPGGLAGKVPWDVQLNSAGVDQGTTATIGNNVDEARVWTPGHTWGSPTAFRSVSATRDYQPTFTNAWYTSGCNPQNVNAAVNPNGNDIDASMVSMFVGHNVMHDWAYYLGFDEGHWNAQQYNFGVTTTAPPVSPISPMAAPVGNDALTGNAQSGAATGSRDNANMNTGADGNHPTTNQFVWQPLPGSFYAPCVDGAYDFSVYGHEYGHLIENRMIGKGVGARQGTHAGSMGEAFGDFDAAAAFNELHVPISPGSDRYTVGAYATGNGYNGIRDFLAGEPMGGEFPEPGRNPKTNPLNYGDFGFDTAGVEVHADGEIWVAVEIDLRELFLLRYPSPGAATDIACARGQIAPGSCPGDRRWIQDYYDSMVLMPRNTTMIQARDAMLAADLARFGGANQDLIWQGFAMRGFGQFNNTTANNDSDPEPDFSAPTANNATLTFSAVSKVSSPVPVSARIYVGDYSARSTWVADTDPATTNDGSPAAINLDDTAQFVPNGVGSLAGGTPEANARWGSYNFVAVAPGYGFLRFKVDNLKAGETRNITLHFPVNYASATQGATITDDGVGTSTNLANTIDDNEATNNGLTGLPVAGRYFVIKLGGDVPVSIHRLGVSALLTSANNRFTALRAFTAYSCRAGATTANPDCLGSIDAGWLKMVTAPANAFPSVNPRPVTPDQALRYFDAAPRPAATHLKFVIDTNQCTGQPSYQGDQDQDPAVNADCRNPPGTGTNRGSEVHVAEVQVFQVPPTANGPRVSVG